VADELVSAMYWHCAHVAPAYGDLEISIVLFAYIFSVDLIGRVYSEVGTLDAKEVAGPYTGGVFQKSADERLRRS